MRKRSYRSDEKGATALEFALLSPVFFFMLLFIIEYSTYFIKKNIAQHILYEASRIVQTGEVQKSANPESFLVNHVCSQTFGMMDCIDLSFDLRSFNQLEDINLPDAEYNEQGHPTNFVFQAGGPEQITAMRISVPHHFLSPVMKKYFQPTGAPAILVGYSVAKNEPFAQ